MTSFLWRKIVKNKWLTLSLIMGNILLIGIVTATPLFTTATMQRIFQEDMRYVQHTRNTFPAEMQINLAFNREQEECPLELYYYTRRVLWPEVVSNMGVPSTMSIRSYRMPGVQLSPYVPREYPPQNRNVIIVGVEGFADNVKLLHGRLPSAELVDGRVIEVLASEAAMHFFRLVMNETLAITNFEENGYLQVRIVGIYTIAQGSEAYWSVVPIDISRNVIMHYRVAYERLVRNYHLEFNMTAFFTQVLDFTQMHIRYVPHYQRTIRSSVARAESVSPALMFTVNFGTTMRQYLTRTENLPITLWILQLPLYVMMALYIYMVSRQILLMDKNDVAVLHSRGASRRQIIGLYILQGLFVGAVSFPIGLGLGFVICHILGGSNGFLEMVQRASLDVRLTAETLLFGGVAALFSFLTMLLPVIGFSKVGIHDHKTSKRKSPIWQRYFLDIICVAAALYGLYNFNIQQEHMAAQMTDTRFVDPLLFANSSLFILGAGLLCLRLFPYLVKLVFLMGRRFFSPSVYASMLKVIRSAGDEQFIMLFLVFTIAIGIFSAQVARTINLNNDHRILYTGGTDVIFAERWRDNTPHPEDRIPDEIIYFEPDFNRFINFEEVDSITRVMRRQVSVRAPGSTVNNVNIMGIDTRSFGETAWFRYDLLPIHINYFLNSLGAVPNGVLLSDNFRTRLGYSVGDNITIRDTPVFGNEPRFGRAVFSSFEVMGFVEHWPGFSPALRTRLPTGEVQITEQYLAIVNLGHIQSTWGVRPYQVWMQTNTDSSQFVRDFISDNDVTILMFGDTMSELVAIRSDPIVIGTNGILTMSFVMTLLVSLTGFLIYWILSIKSRVLQFGIFRAMGLSMRNIISLLVNEQIFITLTALAIGGLVGVVGSWLFVPIIQVSYTAADQVLPLIRIMEARDYLNLYGVLGFMVVLCLFILGVFISRINITQALKLGED